MHLPKGTFTLLMVSQPIARFHVSAAGIKQGYYLYHQRERDVAYDGTQVQLCSTFEVSAVAHDALRSVNRPYCFPC